MQELDEYLKIFSIQLKKTKGDSWATFGTLSDFYPKLRNIIVRDYVDNKLFIYTHSLSDKVTEIENNSASCVCWYSKKHGIQLQFYGQTQRLSNPIEFQKRISNFRDYLGAKPGLPIEKQLSDEINFCVLEFQIEKIVGLKLGRDKHLKFEKNLSSGKTHQVIP